MFVFYKLYASPSDYYGTVYRYIHHSDTFPLFFFYFVVFLKMYFYLLLAGL